MYITKQFWMGMLTMLLLGGVIFGVNSVEAQISQGCDLRGCFLTLEDIVLPTQVIPDIRNLPGVTYVETDGMNTQIGLAKDLTWVQESKIRRIARGAASIIEENSARTLLSLSAKAPICMIDLGTNVTTGLYLRNGNFERVSNDPRCL